ncbi:uncharacterized protein DSM5745_05026 [Aspergillus mulundensis]|uniref:Transcription factor domain-containing protein n=1 Tax=Aspergillus mulundensis TaxID=1810919 RepID=A0A3D8S5A7_9EURO|nr:Uncharacterized protein DSM5745_05026 [Aspergillus mulundensis]RDW81469.1 Uncharacterized protein DSM5745_05026 [Aspergillus mulundensis]
MPQELALSSVAVSATETRALEFFFRTTSSCLAGFLDVAFWKRSVLQLSLSEPSIRLALAALGSMHEAEAIATPEEAQIAKQTAVQMYGRALRSTLDKASTDNLATSVIVMASILFTCFEFLHRDSAAAAKHIGSGINIIRAWRDSDRSRNQLWGRNYQSYEAYFIETELAPILTLFNLNALEFGSFPRNRIILSAIDSRGPYLAGQFETLQEARVAFVDLVTASTELFQHLDAGVDSGNVPLIDTMAASEGLREGFSHWKTNFDDLVARRESTWSKEERNAAAVIQISRFGAELGLAAYGISSECDWDNHVEDYEDICQIAEILLSDSTHYPDELSKSLSLDLPLIYPLHAVAWKCRHPRLRRKGLELLLRAPKREWLLDSRQYHTIFSHIMALEEAAIGRPEGDILEEGLVPPEHARIHDFDCVPQLGASRDFSRHAVTFRTRPGGPNAPWQCVTHYIHLSSPVSSGMPPLNLFSCRRWAWPEMTDPQTARMLKSAVFGELLKQEDFQHDL